MADVEQWDPAAEAVIAAELVGCTLGRRHRPELRTDLAAVVVRFALDATRFTEAMRQVADTIRAAAPILQRFGEALGRAEADVVAEAERIAREAGDG